MRRQDHENNAHEPQQKATELRRRGAPADQKCAQRGQQDRRAHPPQQRPLDGQGRFAINQKWLGGIVAHSLPLGATTGAERTPSQRHCRSGGRRRRAMRALLGAAARCRRRVCSAGLLRPAWREKRGTARLLGCKLLLRHPRRGRECELAVYQGNAMEGVRKARNVLELDTLQADDPNEFEARGFGKPNSEDCAGKTDRGQVCVDGAPGPGRRSAPALCAHQSCLVPENDKLVQAGNL
mmetsp:Transcript_7428/g.21098  ORF Transcript_7428/g.21098 Transcript_7428/m.21098 type:complete len:238 (+) Transcript_7428:257-970(+)